MIIWKPIPDYSDYLISNMGDVRSLKRGNNKLRKLLKTNDGYWCVSLCANGKQSTHLVHQLLMLSFVGPRPEGMVTRHLNGVRSDNRLENLKYGTAKENSADRDLQGRNYQSQKSCCPQGHAYDTENTYVYRAIDGVHRGCRTCARIHAKRKRQGDVIK